MSFVWSCFSIMG